MTSQELSRQCHLCVVDHYCTDSHRYWLEGLKRQLSHWQWTEHTLGARQFSWQMRAGVCEQLDDGLRFNAPELREPHAGNRVLLVTSTVDLTSLLAFLPGRSRPSILLYMHENQFQYPLSDHQHTSVELQMTQIFSLLRADQIVFNSEFNRHSSALGVKHFRAPLPKTVRSLLRKKIIESPVVPVGLQAPHGEGRSSARSHPSPTLIWNHRAEHDKAPETFFAAVRLLLPSFPDLRIIMTGRFPAHTKHREDALKLEFQANTLHWGYVDSRLEYENLLRQGDFVISTALQEFQGLSVLEAWRLGLVPLVPNRLAYKHIVPESHRYDGSAEDTAADARGLAEHFVKLWERKLSSSWGAIAVPFPSRFHLEKTSRALDGLLRSLL